MLSVLSLTRVRDILTSLDEPQQHLVMLNLNADLLGEMLKPVLLPEAWKCLPPVLQQG